MFVQGSAPRGRPLWLEGKCVSYGESMTYWPFRDLVRSWLGVLADEPEMRVRVALRRNVERLFGDRAGELTPYLAAMLGLTLEPDDQARLGELSPEALQYRTFEVVRHWLQRLAEDGPVAVALEDLHWADATSLQLLERLLPDTETLGAPPRPHAPSRARPPRLAASRTTPPGSSRTAPRRSRSRRCPVTPASTSSIRSSARARCQRTWRRGSSSTPTATRSSSRSWSAPSPTRVRWSGTATGWRFDHEADVEIPPTVEKVILARIDRLDPRPHAALMAASVLGREFGLPLLEAVTGDGDVKDSLSSLMRLDLLREARRWPEPEYRFKHALIQEAAYRTLVVDERRAPPREGRRLARGALRRPRGGGRRAAGTSLARRGRRGQGGRVPDAWPATARGRNTRSTKRSRTTASCCRSWATRRAGRDRARPVQARARVPHVPALRGGERDVPAGVRSLAPAGAAAERAVRDAARRYELPPERSRPSFRDRVAEHPALHAAVRPAGRGVAGADDRAVARGAVGDLRRRSPLRLPPPRGSDVVRRRRP